MFIIGDTMRNNKKTRRKEMARMSDLNNQMAAIMAETAREISEDQKSRSLKKKLREVDPSHAKRPRPLVQGGLPSLGKHR